MRSESAHWFFAAFVSLCVLVATLRWGVQVAVVYLVAQIILSLAAGFVEN